MMFHTSINELAVTVQLDNNICTSNINELISLTMHANIEHCQLLNT
jgi:hypothetical protein